MPFNDFENLKRSDLNDKDYVLNLFTRIKMCLRGRLHNRGKKVRNHTSFFRVNGILPSDELTKKEIKLIPLGTKARPRSQFNFLNKGKRRNCR
jgi:hypothetical protein